MEQLVAREAHNFKVAGSSPAPTIERKVACMNSDPVIIERIRSCRYSAPDVDRNMEPIYHSVHLEFGKPACPRVGKPCALYVQTCSSFEPFPERMNH